MSFPARRTGRSFPVSPAQVFKKRFDKFQGVASLGNNNATLLAQIILEETGTIYAVKIGAIGHAIGLVAGDETTNHLWIRCVPNDTALPDLTDSTELETMNGFYVGSFGYILSVFNTHDMNEKFRFRRKCDRNMQLQLLAQSEAGNGTARTVEWSGILEAIIRVK